MNEFLADLWNYYDEQHRELPWRQLTNGELDPYHVLVSEIMLQQTQVPRVIPKYQAFLKEFPDVATLAQAPLAGVLRAWSGLGYNRRAKYLWQAAQQIEVLGQFPHELGELVKLPGIGKNTAGAIMAYAYDQPTIFIETNVRTVFIHHFFADRYDVSDTEIKAHLTQALTAQTRSPREFYWALMDYGTFLKATFGNATQRSKHYTKQSPFAGSKRQIRGQVLRLLSEKPQTLTQLQQAVADERLKQVLIDLTEEALVSRSRNRYELYTL